MEGTNPPVVEASPTALVPSTEPTAPLAPPEWSAVDDRILCDAIEGGASLEALAGAEAGTATQLDLFSVPRTLPQLQARWRQLLFDAPLAEACVARMAPAATAPSRYLAAGKGFAVHRMLPCEPLQAEASEIALAADMLSYSDAENAIVLAEQGSEVPHRSKLLHGIKTRSSRKELVAIAALERTAAAATTRELERAGALAALCGGSTRFLITQRDVLIGRSTEEKKVDIDLTLEGCASKVSREQAHIKLRGSHFKLVNVGRRAILVNNCLVESGHQRRLENNCLIEVGGLRFLFQVNTQSLRRQRTHNRAHPPSASKRASTTALAS